VPVAVRTGVERTSRQQRFERSPGGRLLISLFVILTLVTILTANLPASHLQSLLMKADHPFLNAFDL